MVRSGSGDIIAPCLIIMDKGDQLAEHIYHKFRARRAREVVRGKENPTTIGCEFMVGYREIDSRSAYGIESAEIY